MSNKKIKKLRKEVRKQGSAIEMEILIQWLSMPFRQRFILAMKIIRGIKKGGRK